MDHPDNSAFISYALAGNVHDRPESVISIAVGDEEGEPVGLLEQWSSDAWFYADVDDLEPVEPENTLGPMDR